MIRNCFWIFLVNYIATDDEKQVPTAAFKQINTSGNGKLSFEELKAGSEFFLRLSFPSVW